MKWNWYPSPPEMLMAINEDTGMRYLFECVGTIEAEDSDPGDLTRVFIPDDATPHNKNVVEELEEKHGKFAANLRAAKEFEDFTECAWQHVDESDEQYQQRVA